MKIKAWKVLFQVMTTLQNSRHISKFGMQVFQSKSDCFSVVLVNGRAGSRGVCETAPAGTTAPKAMETPDPASPPSPGTAVLPPPSPANDTPRSGSLGGTAVSDVASALRILQSRASRVDATAATLLVAARDVSEYLRDRTALEREMGERLEALARRWASSNSAASAPGF